MGKSTIAERLVASRPGWLNCDIDILRTLIGGWQDDFAAAGAHIRPVAREMMAAQLATGRGVVLPQLIGQAVELAQFKSLATVCGELGGTDAVLTAGGRARELAVVDRAVFVRSDRDDIDEAVEQIAKLLT